MDEAKVCESCGTKDVGLDQKNVCTNCAAGVADVGEGHAAGDEDEE